MYYDPKARSEDEYSTFLTRYMKDVEPGACTPALLQKRFGRRKADPKLSFAVFDIRDSKWVRTVFCAARVVTCCSVPQYGGVGCAGSKGLGARPPVAQSGLHTLFRGLPQIPGSVDVTEAAMFVLHDIHTGLWDLQSSRRRCGCTALAK